MNNFSTVESDITAMSMRIAGAGETVGMTEAEIMGLAAAMSSLGIESEMGGSAISKLLVSMEVAAETGVDGMARLSEQTGYTRRDLELMASNNSKDFVALADSLGMTTTEMNDLMTANKNLENFAEIAGVSIEEFSAKFNDPNGGAVAAMQMFIGGLKATGTEGASTIEKLDAMGITEIRMRDALLRLANGSGVLTDAISTANVAWDENTALQVEAEKRYATTESQLLLLKNKLMEVAISAGEELLPALNDLIDGLDPLIDGLMDGVKWFAALDGSTKDLALKFAGFLIAGGPFLKFFSTGFKAVGDMTGGFGKFLTSIATMSIEGKKLTDSTNKVSSAMGTLGTIGKKSADEQIGLTLAIKSGFDHLKTGYGNVAASNGTFVTGVKTASTGLSTFLTGLLASPAGVAVAVVAITGIGVALQVLKDDYDNSKKQNELWGDGIDEKTADALDAFKTLNMEANHELDLFNTGVTDSTDKVTNAFDEMIENMAKQGEETKAEINSVFSHLPEEIQRQLQDTQNQRLERIDSLIADATYAEERITEILTTAESERRTLTENEQARIEALQTRIAQVQVELAAENDAQAKHIIGNLSTDIDKLNKEQLQKQYDMLAEKNRALITSFDEDVLALEIYEKAMTPGQYYVHMEAVKTKFIEDSKDLVAAQVATLIELGANDGEIEAVLSNSGMTYAEAMARYAEITKVSTEGMIVSSEGASEAAILANQTWNGLTFDPIEQRFNTNAAEVAKVASESEDTWNELKFVLMNAEMDTNTKEEIKQALIDNGKWNELTFGEKQAIIETNAKNAGIDFMDTNGIWDNFTEDEKNLWINTNAPETKQAFMDTVASWGVLSPEQVQLLMDTNSSAISEEFLTVNGMWESLTPEQRDLIMNTNSYITSQEFLEAYGQWEAMSPEMRDFITGTNADQTAQTVEDARLEWEAFQPVPAFLATETDVDSTVSYVKRILGEVPDEDVMIKVGVANLNESLSLVNSLGIKYGKGTDYHKGGFAILGDGGKREPFLTPDGSFGISPSTDTLINLPRGSKVWSSIQSFKNSTKENELLRSIADSLPRFAVGTNSSFLDDIKMPDFFSKDDAPLQPMVNIYQTINSPEAVDAREAARLSKINMQNLGYLLSRR